MAGCRRGDLKWAATTVENLSTTQPSRYLDVKEADTPQTTQTLLMRAGDVESNPGPKCKLSSHSEKKEDFDDILKKVARRTGDNMAIDTLGKALGFDPADIGRYIATNTRGQHVTYEGTLEMLRDWRNKQRQAEVRSVLGEVFREIKREDLAELLTSSNDLLQNDLLESVVKDIKEYYKRNMCIIQADPTNNDLMFEFNRIYTGPTLSKEDEYDTEKKNGKKKRNPLLYCKLLKTENYGQLPNRLLVLGGGGAGKTTFCSKIAWDWANDLGFEQFKLVAVIPLRKAKNKTVGDVIKSYLPDDNPFTAAQIDEYILSNQEDVFLVIDGLDELWEELSDSNQIVQIILNRLFNSGKVLVTSRQWRAHEIYRNTELKKVYAFIYLDGFSVDNVTEYITKFFNQDASSSQELIDFIYNNDVIVDNMAPFPIYIAMLCIMWREYDGERRKAMSKLMTFSQLFDEMVDLLVDHCGSKDDSQTCPTVQELRQMIPNHLKAIGEIAFQGILDRRLEFPEDTFQSCRVSMELGCKVGVLTREKHATPRRDRRKNPCLEISMVQFPHQLFQEFLAAKFLASMYSSDHDRYERITADILDKKEEIRYLLYFTSAQCSELGLDIVTRLIAKYEASRRPHIDSDFHEYSLEKEWNFIIDVAYESQHQSVAKKVGNQFYTKTLNITREWSAHTISGLLFIKDHLGEVDSFVLDKQCGRTASQDLAEFILSSASLRTMEIGRTKNIVFQLLMRFDSIHMRFDSIPMHAVFYPMLADKVQQCQIQNLTIQCNHLDNHPLPSRDLAEFICQMPHLKSLNLRDNKLHKDFFSKWASIVSSAKGNNQSTTPHTSLRELIVDDDMMVALQSCGDMFDSVEKLSVSFLHDLEFDFLQRVHGFHGVTELFIFNRGYVGHTLYGAKDKPSTMIKDLERVFPQLITLTFRIHLRNEFIKQILESLRETRGFPLKIVRVLTSWSSIVDDGFDELHDLSEKINNENVFRVEVEHIPLLRHLKFRRRVR